MPTSKHGTSLRQQLAVCTLNIGLQPTIKLKKKNKKTDCHHPAVIPDCHVTALHCAVTRHMSSLLFCSLLTHRKWVLPWGQRINRPYMPSDLTPAAPSQAAGPQRWHSCHGDASRAASSTGIWSGCRWWEKKILPGYRLPFNPKCKREGFSCL